MNTELITAASAATTGVKNIFDITNRLIRKQKQNQLISKGELRYLECKIAEVFTREKQEARHRLSQSAQDKLRESYKKIMECDPNSPLGMVALELFRDEVRAYLSYNNTFDRLTELGFH